MSSAEQEEIKMLTRNRDLDYFDNRFTRALAPIKMQGQFMELAF